MADKKINNRTFRVGNVLATRAISLQARLLGVLGPGIERVPTILSDDKQASNAAVIAAITDVFGTSDPEVVTSLISDIISLAQVQRPSGSWEQLDLDGDFTDDKASLFPVIAFILTETFSDFFTGLKENGFQPQAVKSAKRR